MEAETEERTEACGKKRADVLEEDELQKAATCRDVAGHPLPSARPRDLIPPGERKRADETGESQEDQQTAPKERKKMKTKEVVAARSYSAEWGDDVDARWGSGDDLHELSAGRTVRLMFGSIWEPGEWGRGGTGAAAATGAGNPPPSVSEACLDLLGGVALPCVPQEQGKAGRGRGGSPSPTQGSATSEEEEVGLTGVEEAEAKALELTLWWRW